MDTPNSDEEGKKRQWMVGLFNAVEKESERGKILLLAAHIDEVLGKMLKTFLKSPRKAKDDKLFSRMGILSTFAGRIEMAYRLGLIDLPFKHALDLVRKLRNNFAHAIKVESLQQDCHADRVKALSKLVIKGNEKAIEGFALAYQKAAQEAQVQEPPEQVRAYLSCVMLLLLKLELTRHHAHRPDVLLPAKINYKQ